ncbi:MAG: c-type cytochrome [Vicinamibacterales bacterium]|nr:c-type cytochrome [Vicinamibacterales bacterium]
MRIAILVVALASTAAAAQTLPPGPGADVLKAKCVNCHEADIIVSQRLSLAAWTRSVDKMVRWGATITPAEREVLHPYLAANFGPRPFDSVGSASGVNLAQGEPAVSHAANDAGAAIYQRACTACHETDIIEQQRLTRGRWVGSVDKMIRWGATVTPAEKDALVDYLASRFPPR